LALDLSYIAAKNGLAVAMAHAKKTDEAIALANEIVQAEAEYAPAHYNLAWWYALDKNDAAAARPHYAKALELGLAGHKKLDKALSGK